MRKSFIYLGAAALLSMSACVRYAYGINTPVTRDAVLDVNGNWNTQWLGGNADYKAVVFMKQEGNRVTATYATTARPEPGVESTLEGHLDGTLVGNELIGRWDEGGDRFGKFRFVFRTDGRSFEGTWGRGELFDNGGEWDGTR